MQACNKCLRVMLANDEAAAQQLSLELQGLQEYLLAEQEQQVPVLVAYQLHVVPAASNGCVCARQRSSILLALVTLRPICLARRL